jgi:hypothetical protein
MRKHSVPSARVVSFLVKFSGLETHTMGTPTFNVAVRRLERLFGMVSVLFGMVSVLFGMVSVLRCHI